MNRPAQQRSPPPRRRRYLVHLFCSLDADSRACRHIARIKLWNTRNSADPKTQQRAFTDEYELIETINPLLPHGSDVRNVMSHIESPDGFLYLLYLSSKEAYTLGWRE